MTDTVLAGLKARGFALAVVGRELRIRPKGLLTQDVRDLVATHRDGLIAALTPPIACAPLDTDLVAHFAARYDRDHLDRIIARVESRAASPVATPLDLMVLDDWRRIRAARTGP